VTATTPAKPATLAEEDWAARLDAIRTPAEARAVFHDARATGAPLDVAAEAVDRYRRLVAAEHLPAPCPCDHEADHLGALVASEAAERRAAEGTYEIDHMSDPMDVTEAADVALRGGDEW
jgi:hypothetical protein